MTANEFASVSEDRSWRGPIRPLDVGEMLDHAIAMIRDRFKLFFLIAVCLLLPYNILGAIAMYILDRMMWPQPIPADPDALMISPWAFLGGGLFFMIYLGLFIALVLPLTAAAVTHAGSRLYMGDETVTARESWRRAFETARRVIPGVVLLNIAVGIGYMMCIIPGVILQLIWFVYMPVLILENSGVIDGFRRSMHLMNGHKLKGFVIVLMIAIISMGVSGWSAVLPPGVLTVVAVALEGLLESIIQMGSILLGLAVYFSARSQIEHLDLDLLVRETGQMAEEGPVL